MLKFLISVCLLLSAGMQAAPDKPDSKSSRQLYEQAAKAIASADSRAAITPLEKLIADQPASSLACIAVVHLAECYVASERENDAAAILEEWSERIAAASKTTKLDDNLDAHHLRVWLQACKRITDDTAAIRSLETLTDAFESRQEVNEGALLIKTLAATRVELARRLTASGKLELAANQLAQLTDSMSDTSVELQLLVAMIHQQLGNHTHVRKILQTLIESEPQTSSHLLARLELATYALQDREFETAAKLLDPIIASQALDHGLDKKLDCRFRMLWSELELAQGNATHSLEVLPNDEELMKLDEPQQVAVRFSRAEAAAQAGKNKIALEDLQRLSEFALKSANEPNWSVTVALRQCELLLKTKDYVTLAATVEDAKKRFTRFERMHEFDYLLARAAILRIDFDQARVHLQAAIESAMESAGKNTSATARAQWMLGETFFMEQNLTEAIAAYHPVTLLNESPTWQSLALMQTAKCFELLNRSNDAVEAYQRIVAITQDEKLRQEATARIEVIERTATREKAPALR